MITYLRLILVTLETPEIQENPEKDQQVVEIIEELSVKPEKSILDEIILSKYKGLQSAFSRYVDEHASEIMEQYSCFTENQEWLEFCDKSEEVCKGYENRRVDCFLLPEGTVVDAYDSRVCGRFKILDGKVYEANCGPLRKWKRSKRAKRIKALEDYPVKKVYSSTEEYAEKEYGFIYEESTKRYGYYYNPKALFDWITIGGRWSRFFLVKETCKEYSIGDTVLLPDRECPVGYQWVCAARKKDIEWQKMYELQFLYEKKRFEELEHCFEVGDMGEINYAEITEEGIVSFQGLIYQKGETLDMYLKRCGLGDRESYSPEVCGFISSNGIELQDSYFETTGMEWKKKTKEYIESINPESVVVAIDCHM